MVEYIIQSTKNALDKVKNIWNNVMDFFRNIDLLQIGKDVIQGFINGISSMFNAVKNTISKITNFVPNTIKKILGIKSPSRVLMALGRDTGEGLVLGLSGMESDVSKAADGLAAAATPELDMSYATPDGVHASLRSAVNGTVDVNSRDGVLVSAIHSLERRLSNLEVVMEGSVVGRIVEPHVTEIQNRDRRVFDEFKQRR